MHDVREGLFGHMPFPEKSRCLPVKLIGSEGAPTRVILKKV